MFTKPAVFIFGTFKAHLIRVIKSQGDVLDGHFIDIKRHRRLLRGVLLLFFYLLLLGILLEGINQELIVGRAILRLIETGFHIIKQHFLDDQFLGHQLH